MPAEIDPKPDQVTVAIGSPLFDITALATPEHLKRLRDLGLPPNREGGQRGFPTYTDDGRLQAPAETPLDPRYVL